MTVRTYRSTDTSAPVLGNTNGSLIALLYACLVTGYGSNTAAGWTRPYTGTNLAVFRQGTGGNGRYLRVFDGTASARRVHMRGYEAMTAVSTGTNPFPTVAQVNGNGMTTMYWDSNPAGTNPVWTLCADEKFFWLVIDVSTTVPVSNYFNLMAFGTFPSRKSGDIYNDVLLGGSDEASAQHAWTGTLNTPASNSAGGAYVARNDSGTVGAVAVVLRSAFYGMSYVGGGNSTDYPYPDRVSSGLLMAPQQLWADGYWRGHLPGQWDVAHTSASLGTVGVGTAMIDWTGQGALAGRTFELYPSIGPFVGGSGALILETSNTWS